MQEYSKSLEDFTHALKHNPGDEIYLWRGIVFLNLNDSLNAIQDFSMSIKMNPKNDMAYLYKASVLFKSKLYKEALTVIDTGIENNPSNKKLLEIKKQIEQALQGDVNTN